VKHKVCELTGALLDLAVAMAEGERAAVERERITMHHADGTFDRVLVDEDRCHRKYIGVDGVERGVFWLHYSGKWEQGGPIIARERIAVYYGDERSGWHAGFDLQPGDGPGIYTEHGQWGSTALIAAMRAYVASRFGDEVDLP